ncbi:SixA phosphatase family protein [Salinimicrobium xinjiangense]|uniref:SixA phosphatase family protein n=1 Tax=Salinimicrobium xinjiangense TaxID=438596 RepID=UPI0004022B5E|nr:histidine phosphatase family protein [Salinimicrobium xinjiangense]
MKKLILVRHGKSSWNEDLPDHERPVKKRAYKDAELVLNAFSGFVPEELMLWSSDAVRALTTAKISREELNIPEPRFQVRHDLYTFDSGSLLQVIKTCENAVENLMIFGHNPAITGVANSLGDQHFSNVPTTGLCMIEFESNDWSGIKNGKTLLYLFPKNLR